MPARLRASAPDSVGFSRKDPVVLLQTELLSFAGATAEGQLVQSVAIPWFEILRQLERDPDLLFSFAKHPRSFEEFIAGVYEHAGWDQVVLTPRSGDGGRDVIATKEGIGSLRFLDQCKAYSPGKLVTADDVRAMMGVLSSDRGASKGIITTTADFAPGVLTDVNDDREPRVFDDHRDSPLIGIPPLPTRSIPRPPGELGFAERREYGRASRGGARVVSLLR